MDVRQSRVVHALAAWKHHFCRMNQVEQHSVHIGSLMSAVVALTVMGSMNRKGSLHQISILMKYKVWTLVAMVLAHITITLYQVQCWTLLELQLSHQYGDVTQRGYNQLYSYNGSSSLSVFNVIIMVIKVNQIIRHGTLHIIAIVHDHFTSPHICFMFSVLGTFHVILLFLTKLRIRKDQLNVTEYHPNTNTLKPIQLHKKVFSSCSIIRTEISSFLLFPFFRKRPRSLHNSRSASKRSCQWFSHRIQS